MMKRIVIPFKILMLFCFCGLVHGAERVFLATDVSQSNRVLYGVERLEAAMRQSGIEISRHTGNVLPAERPVIVICKKDAAIIQSVLKENDFLHWQPGKEGFTLQSCPGGITVVVGGDDSGVLYGCLELGRLIRETREIPNHLDYSDAPVFVLRGPCIGLQKSQLTYDNAQYDYRYTQEDFPFFYDKNHWQEYLDMLVENRMNTVTLWNGHPFTSLLKLERYPDAQELTDEELEKNIEMFRWLTHEADRRGIWIIQFFYNIHMSHPLARKHGLSYLQREPTPIAREYTRYCIAEFVRNYPNVGLCMCLGEAIEDKYDAEWLCNVIIPGVQDAMTELGLKDEPPIIVRAHSTPIEEVMKAALHHYHNLYTMHKWNQEILAWTSVRGESRRIHESLANLGSMNVVNVHLVSNITPFRWGSPSFIQQCMQSCTEMNAKGLHLYPQRYWNWPDAPDITAAPLKQIDRDWIWYEAWARYAWNPSRPPLQERVYWTGRLEEQFGTAQAGKYILSAYEASGECAPMLIRRFGITDGNRQILSLGMLMTQLIHPERYRVYRWLWDCSAPPGERLNEWAQREWEGQPHQGETPPQVIEEVLRCSAKAVSQAEAAREYVIKNKEEYERFLNDMHCIEAMSKFYAAKVNAAMHVLRYQYSKNPADLQNALPLLEESVRHYHHLTDLTKDTYSEASSYFPDGSRIPFSVINANPKHWSQCVERYDQELENFKRNLQTAVSGKTESVSEETITIKPWPAAAYTLLTEGLKQYVVKKGRTVFSDTDYDYMIEAVATELKEQIAVCLPRRDAFQAGISIEFEVNQPVYVLVGYVEDDHAQWLQLPDVQAVAAAGAAETFEPVLRNALVVSKISSAINVHTLPFDTGRHRIDLGKGAYLMLGMIPQNTTLIRRTTGLKKEGLDWLFE